MSEDTAQVKIIEDEHNLWGLARKPAGCPRCQRVFLIQPGNGTPLCPICRDGTLENQPARLRLSEPERILPFRTSTAHLPAIYSGFSSSIWIKPEDLKPEILLQRTQSLFWPLWLVDCDVVGQWQMEAGFDYQVESTKENYNNGQWVSRKQIENRIRWEPRVGEVDTHVDNVPVPALEEHQKRQEMTGIYPMDKAQNYDPAAVGESIIEVPDLPPNEAWPFALPEVNRSLASLVTRAASAQHQRNFAIKANYQHQHWTQFLLPMYTTYYLDDDGNPQVLVINGVTGEIHGLRLASQKRGLKIAGILAAVAGGLLLTAMIGFLLAAIFPPASLFAGLLGILGLGAGIVAIIPAVWPAQWNRNQQTY